MTAPGTGDLVDAGACTQDTPCFVCRLKLTVTAQHGRHLFNDAPFHLNILGIRTARSNRNAFDDRMVTFFALPPQDAREALHALGLPTNEDALLTDIESAADQLTHQVAQGSLAGLGARRVACNAIHGDGGMTSGHWVVHAAPISTDPGLVRVNADVSKITKQRDDAKSALAELEQARKDVVERIDPKLKELTDAVKSQTGRTQVNTPEQVALRELTAEIAQLRRKYQLPGPAQGSDFAHCFDKALAAQRAQLQEREAAVTAANSPEVKEGSFSPFYKYAFKTADGWEGELHALFPPGLHAGIANLGIHNWTSDNASVALIVPTVPGGRRVASIAGLERQFTTGLAGYSPPRNEREAAKAIARRQQEERSYRERLKVLEDKLAALSTTPGGSVNAVAQAEKSRQKLEQERQKLMDEHFQALSRAELNTREQHVLIGVRDGTPRAPGTLIVRRCVYEDSRAAVPDDAVFQLSEDFPGVVRTGAYLRRHFDELQSGQKIHAVQKTVAADGSDSWQEQSIIAEGLYYEHDGQLVVAPPDDHVEISGYVQATNVHRGHNHDASGPTVTFSDSSMGAVGNWSAGCQVWPRSADFNLFILCAGLDKRLRCLKSGAATAGCERLAAGSPDAPCPLAVENWSGKAYDHSRSWKANCPSPLRPPARAALTNRLKQATAVLEKQLVDAARAELARQRPPVPPKKVAAEVIAQADDLLKQQATQLAAATTDAVALEAGRVALALRQAEWDKMMAARQALLDQSECVARIGQVALLSESTAFVFSEGLQSLALAKQALDAMVIAPDWDPAIEELRAAAASEVARVAAGLPAVIYARANLAQHDWFRRCDVGKIPEPGKCKQRFDYTLIELEAEGDALAGRHEFASVRELDQEFAMKANGSELHPRWSKF